MITRKLLSGIPVFKELSDEVLDTLFDLCSHRIIKFGAGDIIIKEGDIGNCMFIVESGTVDVRIRSVYERDMSVGTLRAGEHFGEQVLTNGTDRTRTASVVALMESTVLKINHDDIIEAVKKHKKLAKTMPRVTDVREDVSSILKQLRIFSKLSDDDIQRISSRVETLDCAPGDMVIQEEQEGESMYVIREGKMEVFILDMDGKLNLIAKLGRGHYFGEQALMPNSTGKRNANVRSIDRASLVKIDKEVFHSVLLRDQQLHRALNMVGKAQHKKIDQILNLSPMH